MIPGLALQRDLPGSGRAPFNLTIMSHTYRLDSSGGTLLFNPYGGRRLQRRHSVPLIDQTDGAFILPA
jgi:hypothetical protein